jgi:hypothetical protein
VVGKVREVSPTEMHGGTTTRRIKKRTELSCSVGEGKGAADAMFEGTSATTKEANNNIPNTIFKQRK